MSQRWGYCPGCPREGILWRIINNENLWAFKRHAIGSKHVYGKGNWICPTCKAQFPAESKYNKHPCIVYQFRKDTSVNSIKYKLCRKGTAIHNLLKDVMKNVDGMKGIGRLYDVAFELKLCLPGLYPPINKPDLNFNWNMFGNAAPTQFCKDLLISRVKAGKPNYIDLDKNVDIVDYGGKPVLALTHEMTRPDLDSKSVAVDDRVTHWRISLQDSKKPKPYKELSSTPINDRGLTTLQKFRKNGREYPYHPHSYPTELVKEETLLLKIYTIQAERLRYLTGMIPR